MTYWDARHARRLHRSPRVGAAGPRALFAGASQKPSKRRLILLACLLHHLPLSAARSNIHCEHEVILLSHQRSPCEHRRKPTQSAYSCSANTSTGLIVFAGPSRLNLAARSAPRRLDARLKRMATISGSGKVDSDPLLFRRRTAAPAIDAGGALRRRANPALAREYRQRSRNTVPPAASRRSRISSRFA